MASRKINPFGDDDDLDDYGGAWGAPAVSRDAISSIQADSAAFSSSPSDILKDTIRKEAVIKCASGIAFTDRTIWANRSVP